MKTMLAPSICTFPDEYLKKTGPRTITDLAKWLSDRRIYLPSTECITNYFILHGMKINKLSIVKERKDDHDLNLNICESLERITEMGYNIVVHNLRFKFILDKDAIIVGAVHMSENEDSILVILENLEHLMMLQKEHYVFASAK